MGENRGDAHPLGKLEKVSTDSAVSKRVQNNSGMERTSLLLIVRKGGREKQEKKVKKKREKNRYGPKSQSRPTSCAKLRSLQIKFYFQKTSSKFSLNACLARRYPASTQPLLFRAHTYLMGQPLFNKGIQLHDEEKRQFSGPTSTENQPRACAIYHEHSREQGTSISRLFRLFSSFSRRLYFQKTIELYHSDSLSTS